MENVDLDAALRVAVVRVVANGEDGGVDGCGCSWGGGVFEVYDGVRRGAWWWRWWCFAGVGWRVARLAVVEGAPAVVDSRGEVVVAANREAGEGDVGSGDAELLGW